MTRLLGATIIEQNYEWSLNRCCMLLDGEVGQLSGLQASLLSPPRSGGKAGQIVMTFKAVIKSTRCSGPTMRPEPRMTKSQRRRRAESAIETSARRDGLRRLSLDRLMAISPEFLGQSNYDDVRARVLAIRRREAEFTRLAGMEELAEQWERAARLRRLDDAIERCDPTLATSELREHGERGEQAAWIRRAANWLDPLVGQPWPEADTARSDREQMSRAKRTGRRDGRCDEAEQATRSLALAA